MDILSQMTERAKANRKRIVLPEGDEPRTLEAANILLKDEIADLILIGDPAVINKMAADNGYEYINRATIFDPATDPKMKDYANLLFELRKAKGMTEEQAQQKAMDPLYLGCLMIKAGDADIIVAGGMESMSNAPYVLPAARWGARMNDGKMIDVMIKDGLWDAFNGYHMGITAENVAEQWGITREELEEFCQHMVEDVNREVDTMGDLESARIYAEWPGQARWSIRYLGQEFPSLAGFYPNPKPVTLSRFLTLQQVTGIYSPFTIEANYNQEVPDYERPFTICHELSHLKGFMREDEANFIAWLACYKSEDAYFRYSAALEGFCYAGNALFKYDREKYRELRRNLCTEAEQDLQYGYQFWHQFDGPVAEAHEKINDAYLKANNQKDGVESYGRVVNLMVGYIREH